MLIRPAQLLPLHVIYNGHSGLTHEAGAPPRR